MKVYYIENVHSHADTKDTFCHLFETEEEATKYLKSFEALRAEYRAELNATDGASEDDEFYSRLLMGDGVDRNHNEIDDFSKVVNFTDTWPIECNTYGPYQADMDRACICSWDNYDDCDSRRCGCDVIIGGAVAESFAGTTVDDVIADYESRGYVLVERDEDGATMEVAND